MKGLLKLTEDKADVARLLELCIRRGVVIQHKREGCYLTPEMVERGTLVRYGQTVVGPGSTFGNRWKLVDTEGRVRRASALEGLKICFKGKKW
ncbi:MAG: hypothetical protein VX938_11825, partial [Myxococcota bacterium]|nr:hypothetical protein [Myxococcota bacterium]